MAKYDWLCSSIYLSIDDTIENNIAFGVEPKDIDQNSLIRASKIANLHNFINDELPVKYNTLVGERGLRLSGGCVSVLELPEFYIIILNY